MTQKEFPVKPTNPTNNLTKQYYGDDDLLDPVGLEHVEVHEPRVADWGLRLAESELSIDCIA
jgi:hypothetical protein